VAWSSGLRALTAEVVSSACATRPALAQARANARPVQSICPDCEALASPVPNNTIPLSCNQYHSSSASLIHNLISFCCVRVIMIMRQNYFPIRPPADSGTLLKAVKFPRVLCTGHKPSVGLGHIRVAYEAAVTAAQKLRSFLANRASVGFARCAAITIRSPKHGSTFTLTPKRN
jgi:hypothetical protein